MQHGQPAIAPPAVGLFQPAWRGRPEPCSGNGEIENEECESCPGLLVRASLRRQILRPGFHLGSPDPYLAEKHPSCPERNSPMCKELHLGLRILRTGRNRNQLPWPQ